ncbi:TetR/AcrR family transcriptional regulator C-terminal ligand-binding domain-containing protein [Microbacterium lacticum]
MVAVPVRARAGRPENPAVTPALARAAVELLAVGETVTVENVCRAVRVSRPVFYRRLPNADALVSQVIAERFASLAVPDTGTLAGDVRAVLESWRELLTDPATLAGVSRVTAAQHRAGVDATGILGPCETAIGLVLDRAVRRGQAHSGADAGFVLSLALGTLLMRFLVPGASEPDDEFLDRLTETVTATATHEHARP